MSENRAERQEELLRIKRIMHIIGGNIEEFRQRLGEIKEDVVDIRKHFWDDVTINRDHVDDQLETYASLKQQAELLSERERSHRHAVQQMKKLLRLKQSPYFGRIDFREHGAASAETVYLGVGSLLDEQGEQFLIFDWRAPISSLYYDYGPGPAEYETPSGTIAGTMERKRQFIFQYGELAYLFDTGLTIGDEMLQQVLGQGADAHMKTIVATIQREQNRIIRNDGGRLLIVSGPAGSGKTSAALQRVAYLLYKYRGMLTADQVILFSPNPMFNRYISTVLPELGEENMEQTTFQQYLEHRMADQFAVEDPFEQMEYVLTAEGTPEYEARLASIAFKSSAAFLDIVKRFKETLETEGLVFKDIKLKGRVMIAAADMSQKLYAIQSTIKLAPRIDMLVEWMEEKLEEALRAERKKSWVQDEIELLEPEDYHKIHKKLQKVQRLGHGAFNEGLQEQELLRDFVIGRHKSRLIARIKRLRFIDMPATYRRLFDEHGMLEGLLDGGTEAPRLWPAVCALTAEGLKQGTLWYEDATPYLYLKELIEGFQTNMNIRHVFVDEAQDYTPFQYEFLKKLFPRSRMTVLGDLNQGIYAYSALQTFDALNGLYGADATETIRLTRTYRSTRPIVEFTRCMLVDGSDIEPFNRDGAKPSVTVVRDAEALHAGIAKRLAELQGAGFKTIAVICKTAQESVQAYNALTALNAEPMRLITKDTADFESGTVVIPSYLAKGIEFDGVVIYDASLAAYGRESERKLFYTACTRAMHQLHLYAVGEASPFVIAADPATYVREDGLVEA